MAVGRRFFLLCALVTVAGVCSALEVKILSYSEDLREPTDGKEFVVNRDNGGRLAHDFGDVHTLGKRETPPTFNITTKISHLNASQQQLFVHWAGEGSDVIICLAKNTQPVPKGHPPHPSSVFISYDYGSSFVDKTENFKLDNTTYAAIDKFHNHPRQKRHMIFRDKFHKVLFVTKDFGKNVVKVKLAFEPENILYYPDDPLMFLTYDSNKTLWVTRDFGQSFSVVQEMVKLYFWAKKWPGKWENDTGRALLVQRQEPSTTTIIALFNIYTTDQSNMSIIAKDVDQFNLVGDFMFATKRLTKDNHELYISYRGSEFLKARFDSELECGGFHIADVSETRLLVAVAHTETLSNLYVSEVTQTNQYMFRLSLERLFCYFPNSMWKDSWLSTVTEDVFADLHKVQGLRGIYLASQVVPDAMILPHSTVPHYRIAPEHLVTLITFDWGGEWKPLTPPQVDEAGYPINCSLAARCSLHLSQKFSNLYPSTKSIPILSSSSAPGIILATGTHGTSLKSHAGIYMSRDAGLTWRKVLREIYFVNLGDHGGIITAVKYFKSTGETREILFSTDEGETWRRYTFVDSPIRVYGLMTEPGENTTIFTIFGSEPSKHSWIIINLDLRHVFNYNCTKEDYKKWSPSSVTGMKMACVMGKKETYERRVAHANCYNGKDYDSPITMETCLCDIEDFECDFGFIRHSSMPECIRNKSSIIDPYGIPNTCKPGLYYNRTKGYRKIDGDACVEGYERNYLPDTLPCPYREMQQFLLIAQKDRILIYDLASVTLPNHRQSDPEVLPVKDLQNVIAVDFDMKNNCVYFADIITDKIGRQCLSGTQTVEYLVESELGSVEGMALDWITNMLYFVDGQRTMIEVIRTDIHNSGRMRKTILNNKVLSKPRGIALHPVAGYMYWTDWSTTDPSVSRAALDGSKVTRLFQKPYVQWPNGITVDHISEHIYWVDAKLDYIATADLNGRHFRTILQHEQWVSHPFSVAVFKDNMFWDDWKQDSFFVADKDHGLGIVTIATGLNNLMDLKVFAHSIQEGTNACSKNDTCSHLCFAQPDKKPPVCLCPDEMVMSRGKCLCPDGSEPYANNTCPQRSDSCSPRQISCNDGVCIPKLWKCDGESDCADHSDEENCGGGSCSPTSFRCKSGDCIPYLWLCDIEKDCSDGSDEDNCTYSECSNDQFKCQNKRCIARRWLCDGEDDCKDGSDEIGCPTSKPMPVSCGSGQFQCVNTTLCLPASWRCDGEHDCMDGSDEKNCSDNKCEISQFQCKISHRCIFESWKCDRENDCGQDDTSDEDDCPKTTPKPSTPITPFDTCRSWMFHCNNKRCVPNWWKCDSVNDCGDNSDEIGCPYEKNPTIPEVSTATPKTSSCSQFQFQCESGDCIQSSWVCDGVNDCLKGEDENHCVNISCSASDQFKCRNSGSCVSVSQVCDGIQQCPDGSDELSCGTKPSPPLPTPASPSCNIGFFPCDGMRCLPLMNLCDDHLDCYDGFDENNCTNSTNRYYQVLRMSVDDINKNATSLRLHWANPSDVQLEFCPAISEISLLNKPVKWVNNTEWISELNFLFPNLQPFTRYNLTVYVRTVKDKKEFPPAKFIEAITAEAQSSAPLNVKVIQKSKMQMEVTWQAPQKPNGLITEYLVFVTPPIPPMSKSVQPNKHMAVMSELYIAGISYTFWVVAKNSAGHSNISHTVTVTSDNEALIGEIHNLIAVNAGENSVSLVWDSASKTKEYCVYTHPNILTLYAHVFPSLTTKENKINVTNLSPGVEYIFYVYGRNEKYNGPKSSIIVKTKGEVLPSVPGLSVKITTLHGTAVQLSWKTPKDSRKVKWEYAVYYSVNAMELYNGERILTNETSVDVTKLDSCESYYFGVSVAGPLGYGPITRYEEPIYTVFDLRARPKSLRVFSDPQNESYFIISWSSSCLYVKEQVGYVVDIKELRQNKTSSFTLLPTNRTEFKQRIKINHGAKYHVQVQTDVPDSEPSSCVQLAPPLPRPYQVQVMPTKNASYIVYWEERTNNFYPKLHYEILVCEGREFNESKATVYVSDRAPFVVSNVKEGTIYSFALVCVSEKGYKSDLSQITSVEVPSGFWEQVFQSGNVVSFMVPVASIVIVLLVMALIIYAVRHRQLQNSFTSFANSYYSTRSGAATFTSNDGLDDEDSPVIRGFSDDEPLVIA